MGKELVFRIKVEMVESEAESSPDRMSPISQRWIGRLWMYRFRRCARRCGGTWRKPGKKPQRQAERLNWGLVPTGARQCLSDRRGDRAVHVYAL
jgi:hypothetical protein